MSRRIVVVTAAAAAGFLLAVLVSAGSASRGIEVRGPARGLVSATGSLTYRLLPAGVELHSNVTLGISFNRTIAKVAHAEFGTVSSCTSSNAFFMVEIRIQCTGLPWTMGYLGFGGTLPNIVRFDVEHLLQSIHAMDALGGSIIDCYYYDGAATVTNAVDSNGTTMTTARPTERARWTTTPESEGCEQYESMTMAGALTLEPAPGVRLM